MASLLALLFATAFVATVFGDLEYYQDVGGSSDDYMIQELKELFKSGEFLPVKGKDVSDMREQSYYSGQIPLRSEYSEDGDQVKPPLRLGDLKRHLEHDIKPDVYYRDYEVQPEQGYSEEPEFYYNMKPPKYQPEDKTPFAVPPVDPRYFQQVFTTSTNKADLKRAVTDATSEKYTDGEQEMSYYDDKNQDVDNNFEEFENSFEDLRHQRQNPNLAAVKINKIIQQQDLMENGQGSNPPRTQTISRISTERDIPSSLMPTSPKYQHVIQQALKNIPGYSDDNAVYLYAIIAGIGAAATVAIVAFAVGWYTMRKKSKAAVDVEYPAYGVTGPNTDVTPSGDRQLAHSAQMYHYQHQKQQIIAMESRGGINERNGSVSDAESEDENDEGDYTVYECPGFATTGEMEVKNPLFLDEPTPATPAQQTPAANNVKQK